MQSLRISDSETMILALQDEIRRDHRSRYDHRLHGVLMVAHGMSCRQVAGLMGDAPRTVENWVNGFERDGLKALSEKSGRGRKSRLGAEPVALVERWLRGSPREVGMDCNLWDGRALSECLRRHCSITLKVRQCQRLFRQLGFRYRTPRPEVAKSDPQRQSAHKKTRPAGGGSRR